MPEDLETNDGEVSDGLSENEYETDLHPHDDDEDDTMTGTNVKQEDGPDGTGEVKKKYDAKDPLRPRRKKARRACYACQRAHLTCGDERPCHRCVKRGLAETCQDGVRKKAKYLHDAPPEALRPVLGPTYNPNMPSTRPNGHRNPSSTGSEASTAVGTYFPQSSSASTYPVFSAQTPVSTLPDAMSFPSQQSPVSPGFQGPGNPQIGGMTVPQVSGDISNFNQTLFDPSNPALFNFNLESLNFGSQYAAMEFGMLGQLTSGVPETPSRDTSISQQGTGGVGFGSGVFGNGVNQQLYDGGLMGGDFMGLDPSTNNYYAQGNLQHGLPHAYAIPAGPTSLQSPSTETDSPQPPSLGFEGSPTTTSYAASGAATSQGVVPPPRPKARPPVPPAPALFPQSILGKRQRDSSRIYEDIKEPYQYVRGFHRVISHLQKRFTGQKILSIAKSLSSFRPSFIACTKSLNSQDLIFMEKAFQRTLIEYEDFLSQIGSPAILCRRTGEVAAVNKEFTVVTGWPKEVLLGKEANLNVNTGPSGVTSGENTGRAGLSTPRLQSINAEALKGKEGEAQPVFIAELLDDDSVVEFYEDFAHLAFEDSRGSVKRKCRLLKYRTQEMMEGSTSGSVIDDTPRKDPRNSILSSRVARIDGEHGISRIEKDGKLECVHCWFVRRDTFDIPMMIVMNFLPCYSLNQEPQQLAV